LFLVTVEARVKRSRALLALHELRTIAHVIDMHQLTKDPSLLRGDAILTPSSPRRRMSFFELTRYLDYCSEMLSLTGKIAALYAQELRDAVVLSAVNEIEVLTTALSRKIWQKIMILQKVECLPQGRRHGDLMVNVVQAGNDHKESHNMIQRRLGPTYTRYVRHGTKGSNNVCITYRMETACLSLHCILRVRFINPLLSCLSVCFTVPVPRSFLPMEPSSLISVSCRCTC